MSEHNYYQNNKSSHNSENDDEFLDQSINDDDFDMVLLTFIKQYPCIYDPNKLNQEKINLAWNNISVEMNEKVEQCQDRYRRLRQYFSKERNRREFVAAGTKRDTKGWALYDCAAFLNPFIIKKRRLKSSMNSGNKLSNQMDSLSNDTSSNQLSPSPVVIEKLNNEVDVEVIAENSIELEESSEIWEINSNSNETFSTSADNQLLKKKETTKLPEKLSGEVTDTIIQSPSLQLPQTVHNVIKNKIPTVLERSSQNVTSSKPTHSKQDFENESNKASSLIQRNKENEDLGNLVTSRLSNQQDVLKNNNIIAQTIQKIGSTLNTVAERLHETSTLPDNLFDTNYLVGRIVVAQLNKMSPKSANKKRKRIVKCLYSSDSDSN